jgi:hypothetical protein
MGPQNMVTTGWALQALRANPGIWEKPYQANFSTDLRVYIEDDSGITGPPDASRATWKTAAATLTIHSNRRALWITGDVPGDSISLKIHARPDAAGTHAAVKIGRDKSVSMTNAAGNGLVGTCQVIPADQAGFTFTLQLPYTVTKDQSLWANGVEHGRLSIVLGEDRRNLYLASPEEQVRGWLLHQLAGGLRTWEAIFQERGFIPTGIGTGRPMDNYSDTGAYAHLISAGAQWLLYLDNKFDWDQHHVPNLQ